MITQSVLPQTSINCDVPRCWISVTLKIAAAVAATCRHGNVTARWRASGTGTCRSSTLIGRRAGDDGQSRTVAVGRRRCDGIVTSSFEVAGCWRRHATLTTATLSRLALFAAEWFALIPSCKMPNQFRYSSTVISLVSRLRTWYRGTPELWRIITMPRSHQEFDVFSVITHYWTSCLHYTSAYGKPKTVTFEKNEIKLKINKNKRQKAKKKISSR